MSTPEPAASPAPGAPGPGATTDRPSGNPAEAPGERTGERPGRVDSRARFTVRGWSLLAAAVVCLAAATWLGRKDVLALALFLGMLPLFAALAMWLFKPRVLLKRSVDPPLVTVGDAASVTLRVRRRSSFGGRHGARNRVPEGSQGTAVEVHEYVEDSLGRPRAFSVPVSGTPVGYTVRPRRRGVYELGPATVRVSDPFGVVTELLDVAERTSLFVAPEAEELSEQSSERMRESGGDPSRRAMPQPGPDNVTTREYRHGDPMRRVHWAASAKHGELMVRQEDPLSTRRSVLVLDCESAHWRGDRVWAGVVPSTEEFEWAVRMTAAVIEHLSRRETVIHALDGRGRPLPRGEDPVLDVRSTAVDQDAALEVLHGLARVAPGSTSPLTGTDDPLAARLDREALDHPVLLITGTPPVAAAERFVAATARSGSATVVMVVEGGTAEPGSARVFKDAGWAVVLVNRWSDVDTAWSLVGEGGSLLGSGPHEELFVTGPGTSAWPATHGGDERGSTHVPSTGAAPAGRRNQA